jgi:hypothetical protein
MSPVRHVIYLHGFASSPNSSKAGRFRDELASRGIGYSCPDFNQPEFETLTVRRMLDQVRAALDAVPAGPVALVGSSLGGFVALHAAAEDGASAVPKVDRVILMAPALDFGGNRLRLLGEQGIEQWRREGSLEVFHYADGTRRRVSFALYEDAARYDAFTLESTLPTLVFQGRYDESVDPAVVEGWSKSRPSVDLRILDDNHQLTASVDRIWRESARFLGLK